ncbi:MULTISPECIES: autoinducer binding domain-containing protein [Achromobacter]|uniref:LuxR family transcriptional regulator n=1 Tax=Alcaligenes xylosoxydans xylosoxydans TaxID=85698 RepID=A0A424WBJ2_ALCXX|nr:MULTISPECIES: autoinducer binding domain-containing protein [Achromobacter]MBC9906728.1 autoinducer binding domain-containing protein [Achromobacter xylosoxidans]MBD0870282.1 autoinducer binding domain-containing protein [Achromobacter xylosoxidans]MDH1299722.1 autoinducer binding domain-containing protein [Achromobacter sp. GD03932]QNP83652.1 autoinducer binding domain-containing protein [Achromobacter xylosoxidans]RPJ90719.1 LuxR family transcriptional regulator [Achromobacter xylosoxidan
MKPWAQDLLLATNSATTEQAVFTEVATAALNLGFSYCGYVVGAALPFTNPQVVMISNYPISWQERYAQARYVEIDPTVKHCGQSAIPIVWSDRVFAGTPELWDEAQAAGLCVGWSQSNLDAYGTGGMLTLARQKEQLSDEELISKELRMRWLVTAAHLALSRVTLPRFKLAPDTPLTRRETEILKWAADGKTSSDVSEILAIAESTVRFHTKNAISKLGARNRTAAVARAALLGLLR